MITRSGWLDLRMRRPCENGVVASVLRKCYTAEDWTSDDVERFMMTGRNAVKLITLENDIVGVIMYRIDETQVSLARLAILPRYRRRGYGRFAVRSLTGRTSMFRCRRFTAIIRDTDKVSWNFLRSCGFFGDTVLPEHYRNKQDAYLLETIPEQKQKTRRSSLAAVQ